MKPVLFLAHTEADGTLAKSALEALNLALSLRTSVGTPLVLGLIGGSTQSGADAIAGCGADKIYTITDPALSASRYATDAAALEAICRASGAGLVIAAATARFSRVMAGVAQRLGGRADTHITGASVVNGTVQASRWYYRQRIEATLQRRQEPWILLIDPGSQPAWAGAPGTAATEPLSLNLPESLKRTSVTGVREPAGDAQTIKPDAKVLLVAGAGWTKKQGDGQTHVPDAEKLILGFLRAARASLGSTKSLVDLGGEGHAVLSFLTHFNQVGQTGSTPRHPKGLATCCHGEEPHTVGWRFINERRAVNLDPNCGWARGKADVLYVADAFAVMSKLNALASASQA